MCIRDSIDTAPFQLDAIVYPENAVDKSVTWSSDNTSVATVSNTGLLTPVGGGTTTIRATACNGVYGTTTVSIVESSEELPEDLIIRKDGRYLIPADLTGNIVITDNAHNVSVVGSSSNMADNPYKGLTFTSENENLNLTIDTLNVQASGGKPVIQFKGAGNTLNLSGCLLYTSPSPRDS